MSITSSSSACTSHPTPHLPHFISIHVKTMAPRQPKPKLDDASLPSTTPSPLKPKTEKAKVEKASKGEKSKTTAKAKVEKAVKAKEKSDEKESAKVEGKEKGSGKGKKVAGEGSGAGKDGNGKDGNAKEKVKPVTGDEAVELIARYLKEQNRPYSATEVSANLHGKVTKTVADKLMKEMEQNGQIKAKATNGDKKGSQWVFWAIQDPADAASPTELATMEATISTLRSTLPALKLTLKTLTSKHHTLKSAPTTSELATMVETLRAEMQAKKVKLLCFKDGSVKMVTREEKEKVEKEYKYWAEKRGARKKAFGNLEAELTAGMSREDVWERLGLEEDTYE